MILQLNKSLYPLDIIQKAAFVFTEYAYILLDEAKDHYIVHLTPKDPDEKEITKGEFENELLAQLVRDAVSRKTRNIRELIYNRALSSSLILDHDAPFSDDQEKNLEECNISELLRDWFDHEDEVQ